MTSRAAAPPLPPWEETLAEVTAWDRWWDARDDDNETETEE
ncbi:hypothetical protein ACIOEX_01540 [Streptomyces sp. NPDC087850]